MWGRITGCSVITTIINFIYNKYILHIRNYWRIIYFRCYDFIRYYEVTDFCFELYSHYRNKDNKCRSNNKFVIPWCFENGHVKNHVHVNWIWTAIIVFHQRKNIYVAQASKFRSWHYTRTGSSCKKKNEKPLILPLSKSITWYVYILS